MRRFIKRHASALAVLLVGVISVMSISGTIIEARLRAKDVDEASAERAQQICVSIIDNRTALLELTSVVLADESPELPLTMLPEFQALDPKTQDYLRALAAAASDDDGPSLRERIEAFREGLLAQPLPDFCPEEEPRR